MREPMQWSFPVGRLFEATVRVHVMLPVVLLGLYLKALKDLQDTPGAPLAIAAVMAILFFSILLHEFGHVFAARAVGGDCEEVVLWPLGGLAMCELPSSPRAHFLTALAGPLVNLMLCVLSAAFLIGQSIWPPLNPLTNHMIYPNIINWQTGVGADATWYQMLAARVFLWNWMLFLLNLLPAYPLDGGRMLHSVLWARSDDRTAAGTSAYVGFGVMLVMLIIAIYQDAVLLFMLAVFIYLNCRQMVMYAEGLDEGGFGVDMADAESSRQRKPKPNFLQRWRQQRAARIAQQEREDRETEERRLDELLDKVQRLGKQSLSPEEERFLTRVSARYRNNRS
jgi:stage IV sporulation protein FB